MSRYELRELGRCSPRQVGHCVRYGWRSRKSRQHVEQQHYEDQAGLATVAPQRSVKAPWAGRLVRDRRAQTRRQLIGHVLKVERRLRRQCVRLPVVLRAGLREYRGCHSGNVTDIHEREPGVSGRKEDAVSAHQLVMERAGEVLHEVGWPQQRVRHAAGHQPLFDVVVRDKPIAFRSLHRQKHDVRDAALPRPGDQITKVVGKLWRTQQKEAVAVGQRGVLTGVVKKVEAYRLRVRINARFFGRTRDVAHSRTNDDVFEGTQSLNHG